MIKGPQIVQKASPKGEIYFSFEQLNATEKDFIIEALQLLYVQKREHDIIVQQNFNAFKNLLGFSFIDNSRNEVDQLEYLVMLLEQSQFIKVK